MFDDALDSLHRRLARLNRRRLRPGTPDERFDPVEEARSAIEEERWLRQERAAWAELAAEVPGDPDELLDWFEMLEADGPGQHDPFFDFMEQDASLDDVRWFLRQEAAAQVPVGELLALVSRGLPVAAQHELARAQWDELGRGEPDQMPAPLFARLAEVFAVFDEADEPAQWEAVAVANTTMGFAHNRRWAFHAIGAVCAAELTEAGRSAQITRGLRRLGLPLHAAQYYARRAETGPDRWERWSRDILCRVVEDHPGSAPWIAEGALARLEAGRRCFERYRGVLCTAAAA